MSCSASGQGRAGHPDCRTPSWSAWPLPRFCWAVTATGAGCGSSGTGWATCSPMCLASPATTGGCAPPGQRCGWPGAPGPHHTVVVDQWRLLDATPVPCGASRETAQRSALAGWASYGWERSHSRRDWGLKLYLLAAPDGMAVAWGLATPGWGARVAAGLLGLASGHGLLGQGMVIAADKGLAGRAFAQQIGELGAVLVRPTAVTSRTGSGRWVASASGSRAPSTPAKTSSGWNAMAPTPRKGCGSGSPSGCSPWPPGSGSTGSSASTTSAAWSPTTINHPTNPHHSSSRHRAWVQHPPASVSRLAGGVSGNSVPSAQAPDANRDHPGQCLYRLLPISLGGKILVADEAGVQEDA